MNQRFRTHSGSAIFLFSLKAQSFPPTSQSNIVLTRLSSLGVFPFQNFSFIMVSQSWTVEQKGNIAVV